MEVKSSAAISDQSGFQLNQVNESAVCYLQRESRLLPSFNDRDAPNVSFLLTAYYELSETLALLE